MDRQSGLYIQIVEYFSKTFKNSCLSTWHGSDDTAGNSFAVDISFVKCPDLEIDFFLEICRKNNTFKDKKEGLVASGINVEYIKYSEI